MQLLVHPNRNYSLYQIYAAVDSIAASIILRHDVCQMDPASLSGSARQHNQQRTPLPSLPCVRVLQQDLSHQRRHALQVLRSDSDRLHGVSRAGDEFQIVENLRPLALSQDQFQIQCRQPPRRTEIGGCCIGDVTR